MSKLNLHIDNEMLSVDLDSLKFNRIININKEIKTETVYDLEINNIKNYNTSIGIAHNGGGKRKGSFAIYLEPWHSDVLDFLDLRKNNGKEELRARDLNLAIWAPDLFFQRVKDDADWTLMDPNKCKGLQDVYGEEFDKLYTKYESEGSGERTIKARELWAKILESCVETGEPYILAKDSCNKKSNQKNLGAIKSSNLCAEIVEYSDSEKTAVCFPEDTYILTKNGYRKIIDCDDEDVFVPFKSDSNFEQYGKFEKAKLINNGKKPVYEIETYGGIKIQATENHFFLIREDKVKYKYDKTSGKRLHLKYNFEWKPLNKIEVGDKIHSPVMSYYFTYNNTKYSEEYVAAGWMLGDGWQSERGWGVCFSPKEIKAKNIVLSFFENLLSKFSNQKVNIYVQKNGVMNWQSSCTQFKQFLHDKFGFERAIGPNKKISYKIFKENKDNIASFLSGLFSAYGSVYLNKKKRKYSITLSSSSLCVLEKTKLLLNTFGISSRIVYTEIKKRKKHQGQLVIHDEKSIIAFKNTIGFYLSPEKSKKLDEIIYYKNKYIKKPQRPFNFHTVKNITYVGEKTVYDLSLKDRHNFVANGYTVHNCNLASISLPSCVDVKKKKFDFDKLYRITSILVKNINKVIDIGYYPTEKTKNSNLSERPEGIGVQGLASVFALLRLTWDSEEAKQLNKDIFETMYYAALETSCELAKKDGPYPTFKGSPASEGILQPDLWEVEVSNRYDWDKLKKNIKKHGLRNSLNLAAMPTASTSQILGNSECFEPFTNNLFKRTTLSGEFIQVNKHLVNDLIELNLWNDKVRQKIIANEGSVQNIKEIPDDIKELYKTIWEIPQRIIIDMAADRGPFICQSQSMNLYFKDANFAKLTSAFFYAWEKGLKTIVYYTRSSAAREATKFTVDKDIENESKNQEDLVCSLDNPEACDACGA